MLGGVLGVIICVVTENICNGFHACLINLSIIYFYFFYHWFDLDVPNQYLEEIFNLSEASVEQHGASTLRCLREGHPLT